MDFKDQILQLASRVSKMLPQIQTEESTKNALVMPFIQILGYDVFNPFEVNPELIADVGLKKGEKVDYAIMKDNEPIILIECKHHSESLDDHSSQLLRYFHTTKAKFGILTNGINYRIFTDLDEINKMDLKPFLEFNITDMRDVEITELKKFHKSYFDVENIFNTANELRYSNEIKSILINEFKNPTEPFVKFFISQVYKGKAMPKVIIQFTELVRKSINQLISDMISERLKSALASETEKELIETQKIEEIAKIETAKDSIITTEEELEGFYIVKAILRKTIEGNRISFKDYKSFFGIILDGKPTKQICRLCFNNTNNTKYLAFLDENKKEIKYELKALDNIYDYSEQIMNSVMSLEKPETKSE